MYVVIQNVKNLKNNNNKKYVCFPKTIATLSYAKEIFSKTFVFSEITTMSVLYVKWISRSPFSTLSQR